jgi:hypothetical protein
LTSLPVKIVLNSSAILPLVKPVVLSFSLST